MTNLFLRRMLLIGLILSPGGLLAVFLIYIGRHGSILWLGANVVAVGDQVFGAWTIFPPLVSWMVTGFVAGFLIYFAFCESFRMSGLWVRNACIAAAVIFLAVGAVVWPRIELATGGRMLLSPRSGHAPGEVRTVAEMEFVWIPPGRFLMGSPDDEPGHKDDERSHLVTLTQGFWLGRYEVSQAQWVEYMKANPSEFQGEDLPVQGVSWEDSYTFAKLLREYTKKPFRLPTEAEWEYASRAGSSRAFGVAETAEELADYGWFSVDKPRAPGQKKPNDWGLYDMNGNMWEWCADWYGEYPTAPRVTDPVGPENGTYHVLRGGGWSSGAEDCRCARRYVLVEGYFRPKNDIGLRLALSDE